MNLTTPPPVQELDPQYAEDLRAELVRSARLSRRERSTWVPILAAACGVAVIAGGVVASTRSGGDSPAPVGQPPRPTATSTKLPEVPADQSARISLDLGPASRADSLAAAKRCLVAKKSSIGEPNSAVPADAASATWHSARWQKTMPGHDGTLRAKPDKQLVQSFTTKTGVRVQCLDSNLLTAFDPVAAGIPWDRSQPLNAAEPLNGRWFFNQVRDGRDTGLFTAFSFTAMPNVARVEIRIRWTGGASAWYGVVVTGGEGYVAAFQRRAINKYQARVVDFRAFDQGGRELVSDIEYG